MPYKKDQGRLVRMAAFWSLACLVVYGAVSLHGELTARFGGVLARPFFAGMPKIPVLGVTLNAALLIVVAVLSGALWLLYRWHQKPKIADLLIETEAELRKVTWPTMPEAINSSIVVMVCVLFLMMYLAGADWLLGRWSTLILIGTGS